MQLDDERNLQHLFIDKLADQQTFSAFFNRQKRYSEVHLWGLIAAAIMKAKYTCFSGY